MLMTDTSARTSTIPTPVLMPKMALPVGIDIDDHVVEIHLEKPTTSPIE